MHKLAALATRIASPEGVVIQMTYNVFDNVTSITQGGVTESRVYDTYQQLCKTVVFARRILLGEHSIRVKGYVDN